MYQCALHDVPLTVSHLSITGAKEKGSEMLDIGFHC